MAQWIRHRPTEPGIAGSSPAEVICAPPMLALFSSLIPAATPLLLVPSNCPRPWSPRLVCSKLLGFAAVSAKTCRASLSNIIYASAGNRARATSMATMYSTTRPLMLLMLAKSLPCSPSEFAAGKAQAPSLPPSEFYKLGPPSPVKIL